MLDFYFSSHCFGEMGALRHCVEVSWNGRVAFNGVEGVFGGSLKEIFLKYIGVGAMTKEQLAEALNVTERTISDMVRAGKIPTIARLRQHRFDPNVMIDVFCSPPKASKKPRSLTIERHKTGAKPGGYAKCL